VVKDTDDKYSDREWKNMKLVVVKWAMVVEKVEKMMSLVVVVVELVDGGQQRGEGANAAGWRDAGEARAERGWPAAVGARADEGRGKPNPSSYTMSEE
jgi:hypothetical protein